MKKDIFIILPFKESLDPNQAGAVSLYVKDTTKHSKYKNEISIISSDNLKNKSQLFRNKNYITNFCEKYKSTNIKIIEISSNDQSNDTFLKMSVLVNSLYFDKID